MRTKTSLKSIFQVTREGRCFCGDAFSRDPLKCCGLSGRPDGESQRQSEEESPGQAEHQRCSDGSSC